MTTRRTRTRGASAAGSSGCLLEKTPLVPSDGLVCGSASSALDPRAARGAGSCLHALAWGHWSLLPAHRKGGGLPGPQLLAGTVLLEALAPLCNPAVPCVTMLLCVERTPAPYCELSSVLVRWFASRRGPLCWREGTSQRLRKGHAGVHCFGWLTGPESAMCAHASRLCDTLVSSVLPCYNGCMHGGTSTPITIIHDHAFRRGCAYISAFQAEIFACRSVSGMSSSSLRGVLLNGSSASDSSILHRHTQQQRQRCLLSLILNEPRSCLQRPQW